MITIPDKREAIVAAALTVLGEEGYAGFTQPKVAARAGLRQSHLTYYFPTRLDLLEAVALVAIDRRLAKIADLFTLPDSRQRLSGLAAVLASAEETRVLLALVQAADKEPTVRTLFDDFARRMSAFAQSQLDDEDIQTAEFAALLHAVSVGLAVVNLATRRPDGAQRVATTLSLFYRLLTEAGTKASLDHRPQNPKPISGDEK